jgi:hypothetical protein
MTMKKFYTSCHSSEETEIKVLTKEISEVIFSGNKIGSISILNEVGQGKITAPLSANVNVLSAPPRLLVPP